MWVFLWSKTVLHIPFLGLYFWSLPGTELTATKFKQSMFLIIFTNKQCCHSQPTEVSEPSSKATPYTAVIWSGCDKSLELSPGQIFFFMERLQLVNQPKLLRNAKCYRSYLGGLIWSHRSKFAPFRTGCLLSPWSAQSLISPPTMLIWIELQFIGPYPTQKNSLWLLKVRRLISLFHTTRYHLPVIVWICYLFKIFISHDSSSQQSS